MYNCPLERLIPIWIIVGGITFVVHVITAGTYLICCSDSEDDDEDEQTSCTCFSWFNTIFILFHVAWFIASKAE